MSSRKHLLKVLWLKCYFIYKELKQIGKKISKVPKIPGTFIKPNI
jgi:hypothetical protein